MMADIMEPADAIVRAIGEALDLVDAAPTVTPLPAPPEAAP